MKLNQIKIAAVSAFVVTAVSLAIAFGGPKAVVVAKGDLKWKDMGIPGVVSSQVSGDMSKGPSRFFLKYPAGFVTPSHYHSADHYATIVSGWVTLTADGKTTKLGPGSYFSLTGKIPHVAKVEGNEEAVFFIQADGPWDAHMVE